jgi:hypothetical protein
VAVAHHQPPARLVPLDRVRGEIRVDLGLQRGGQHPPGALAHQLVQVQAQLILRLGIDDYTQHAAFLPRRRWPAGAPRICHPGRYAALTSPDPIHNFRSYLTGEAVPLFVFDGGYDSAQLTLDLADAPAAVLVRLRSDRCFYTDPPPRPSGATGRPRRHGAKFAFADPTTWPTPTATLTCQDDQYGTVTVAAWGGLHPKQQRHPGHGSRGPRPIVRGTILRVQVERVPARTRPPKVLWLWWAGPGTLDLDLTWRAYVRRFDLEHTIRFCKQTLGWTTPRPRHPAQADRWTWLVLAGYTQLRLARAVATDARLPWERPRPQPRLSPYRVRRGFPRLLCALGSPAAAPKPSGCSSGRPRGRASGPAVRHPALKKPAKRPRSRPPRTARAT